MLFTNISTWDLSDLKEISAWNKAICFFNKSDVTMLRLAHAWDLLTMEATYSCNIPISLLPQQLSIFLVNHSHLLNMPQLLLTETLLPSSYIPSFLYTTLWQNSWKYFSTLIVSTISPSNHPSPFHFTPPLHRNCSPRSPMISTFPMVKIHSQSAYY